MTVLFASDCRGNSDVDDNVDADVHNAGNGNGISRRSIVMMRQAQH